MCECEKDFEQESEFIEMTIVLFFLLPVTFTAI